MIKNTRRKLKNLSMQLQSEFSPPGVTKYDLYFSTKHPIGTYSVFILIQPLLVMLIQHIVHYFDKVQSPRAVERAAVKKVPVKPDWKVPHRVYTPLQHKVSAQWRCMCGYTRVKWRMNVCFDKFLCLCCTILSRLLVRLLFKAPSSKTGTGG